MQRTNKGNNLKTQLSFASVRHVKSVKQAASTFIAVIFTLALANAQQSF